jgi:hypothetical protein
MRLALFLLAGWASAERNQSSCEADTGGVCLLQSFLSRSTAGDSKVGVFEIPESNSGSYCRLKNIMPYWSVPGEGSWQGMTKFGLSCDGQFSYCDKVREAAETQCRMVILDPFECVGGAGVRDEAVFNGPLMPIPDRLEKARYATLNVETTFEVDGNVFLCSMFGKIMAVDEDARTARFDSFRLRVTKTRTEINGEPGEVRLAIQDLEVHAESVEYGHEVEPVSPGGDGEYPNGAGPVQAFDKKGEESFPMIDTTKGGTPGVLTWSYDEPVCMSEIRFQTAKEGWWNCPGDMNCADPIQWVLEGEEKLDSGEHMDWVPILTQDSDFPMPTERGKYTELIPVQDCGMTTEKAAKHAASKAEIEENANEARTRYRFTVKKTRPGHHSGKPMFHIQEIEFDADPPPVKSEIQVSAPGLTVTAGAGPEKLLDDNTNNNPYVDKTAATGGSERPVPLEFEFKEPTCIRAFRFMTSKEAWWSCNSKRCGDPLQWELEGYDDSTSKLADKYGLQMDLVGSEWKTVQLQSEDYPTPNAPKQWSDWITVGTCGGPKYFDEFRFTLKKTPGGHFSGNMMFALDELEIDATGQTSHNKLEPVNPKNVGGHNPAGGADISKAFDGMVGVAGNLPFVDDSAGTADYPKEPGTVEWSLRETGCISRFRFATASSDWWTCNNDVCSDPIQWTLEGKLDQNGADWVMLQEQSTDYPTPTQRSTFTEWIPVSDCEKSGTEKALANQNRIVREGVAAQRRLAYRFRMLKSAKPHWSGRMLMALGEFELDTDPPVPMANIGIENPGGAQENRVVFLKDGKVNNGGPFLDTSSVDDDTKMEVAPLEFHFESPVCVNKFRFSTPQDSDNAWWYGDPPNQQFGIPSHWVFEGLTNDGEWEPVQEQYTDFALPSGRGEWADWVTVASCGAAPGTETHPSLFPEITHLSTDEQPAPNIPVLEETATVNVNYKHIVGYQIDAAPGAPASPEELPGTMTYAQCEEECAQRADCAGFLMLSADVAENKPTFCFVYTTDQWKYPDSVCKSAPAFDVFIKPDVGYDVNAKCI